LTLLKTSNIQRTKIADTPTSYPKEYIFFSTDAVGRFIESTYVTTESLSRWRMAIQVLFADRTVFRPTVWRYVL